MHVTNCGHWAALQTHHGAQQIYWRKAQNQGLWDKLEWEPPTDLLWISKGLLIFYGVGEWGMVGFEE